MPTSADLRINIIAGTLPSGAVYNAQEYFNAIVNRMTATVASGNVLWGQLGGDEPNGKLPGSDGQSGLWFGNPDDAGHGYWNDWNDDAAKYLPIPLVCGQYIDGNLRTTSIVCGASTDDRIITTPDSDGIIALTSDIPQSLGTQTYSGMSTITLDWDNRAPTYVIMSANLTLNMTHAKNGLVMDVWLENASGSSSTTYTVTVPATVWPDGTGSAAPALSSGVSGMRVIDHIRIYRIGGYLFGQLVSKNYQIPLTADHTLPHPVSADGSGNTINITMDNVLAGGSLLPASFVVLVNGNSDAVTAGGAIYSGTTVTVNVATAFKEKDKVTIKYVGTDMKSIGGNTVPVFGPIDVDVAGGGGGIHNDRKGPGGHGAVP